MSRNLRPIAFYLPQFYPIPENESWLGKGFTDWKKVIRAGPLFKDHYQPHIPADLGFYDLRLTDSREEQAKLARSYGIYGFCYYHYWFNGKIILDKPFNEVLKSGKPDFPFCLCWANENWTKKWNGSNNEVLISHNYNLDDDKKHIQYLLKCFEDPRYIKVDGKPVLLIYRTELFPDIKRTADLWRDEARLWGFTDLYLIKVESYTSIDPKHINFDAAIEFQPDWKNLPSPKDGSVPDRILNKLRIKSSPFIEHTVIDYNTLLERMLKKEVGDYKLYRGLTPMWDNSARRLKEAVILHDSKPEYYEKWFKGLIKRFNPFSPEENFIFINAWNEWAEGNHLEPCEKWGKAYLEATLNALTNA